MTSYGDPRSSARSSQSRTSSLVGFSRRKVTPALTWLIFRTAMLKYVGTYAVNLRRCNVNGVQRHSRTTYVNNVKFQISTREQRPYLTLARPPRRQLYLYAAYLVRKQLKFTATGKRTFVSRRNDSFAYSTPTAMESLPSGRPRIAA